MDSSTLLSIRDLRIHFFTYDGTVEALNGVDLDIGRREIVGLVGEQGSGKSVLAKSIMNLVEPPGKIVAGEILFEDRDLLGLSDTEIREVRGKGISIIMNNPREHLHPLLNVGQQVANTFLAHDGEVSKPEAWDQAIDMLTAVGIADPERRARDFPHQLSGGMAQRILIAMALVCSPKLLIADDATDGLDVTIQRQVLDLVKELVTQTGSSALVITHDLGIVAQYCERVAVIYKGQIVEHSATADFFSAPEHPYSQGLLKSIRSAYV